LTEKGKNAPVLTDDEVSQLLLEVQRQGKRIAEIADHQVGDDGVDEESEEELPEDADYKTELLTLIGKMSPSSFERICQRLLRESGFEQVTVTGRSRDGGIDGIGVLKVNLFVAFKVLFQCKRYTDAVGPSVVRDFRGAMQGRADKGIILTTSTFTAEATKESVRDGVPPIELVDGERLIELFVSLELGLVPRTTYDIDFGFFSRFEQQA
jgi:restriction system protein